MILQKKIENVCALLAQAYPDAKIALNYTNRYQLLVAVVLSAQTTDKAVNAVTQTLFLNLKTPYDLLCYSQRELEEHLSSLGLYRSKAKYLKAMSQQLIANFDGQVPDSLEDLETLAGVGKKTAYVVLNESFGQDKIAVDTHVFRVVRRLGLSKASTPDEMMDDLDKKIPVVYKKNIHHHFISFGRERCKARAPVCQNCFLQNSCIFFKNSHKASTTGV